MIYADDLMRWYVGTRKKYNNIRPEDIDPNGCYFTIDTREIFLDGVCYTGCLILYRGERPAFPTPQKLYLNLDNLEVSLYKDDKWIILFSAVTTEFISADPGDTPTANWVSGAVIQDYARRLINETIHDMTYHDIRYNKSTGSLELLLGDNNENVLITHIANKLIMDDNSHTLYVLDAHNNVLTSEVIYPKHTIKGDFDIDRDKLVFTFSTGTKLEMDVKNLVNLHGAKTTSSMITTLDRNNKDLSIDLKISKESDNAIEIKDDGLFVDLISKMDKIVGNGFKDHVLLADENGNAEVGPHISTLATEYIVYTKINKQMLEHLAPKEAVHNHPDFNVYMGTAEEVFAILKYPEDEDESLD